MLERIRLVRVNPPGYLHGLALQEVIEALQEVLTTLGFDVDSTLNQPLEGATNIYFLAHLLQESERDSLPPGSILYNFEQIFHGAPALTPIFLELVRRHEVWDYSQRNLTMLRFLSGARNLRYVPVGYAPGLTRIPSASEQDIDVLFYGSINERRRVILGQLRESGLRVEQLFGVYGSERDAYIARAKVVLNLHYYPSQILEMVRVSYLLANAKALVCECEPDSEFDPGLRGALRAVPYTGLVKACVELVADAATRRTLETRALEAILGYDWAPVLDSAFLPVKADCGHLALAGVINCTASELGLFLGSLQPLLDRCPGARVFFETRGLSSTAEKLLFDFAELYGEPLQAGHFHNPRVVLEKESQFQSPRETIWSLEEGFAVTKWLDCRQPLSLERIQELASLD